MKRQHLCHITLLWYPKSQTISSLVSWYWYNIDILPSPTCSLFVLLCVCYLWFALTWSSVSLSVLSHMLYNIIINSHCHCHCLLFVLFISYFFVFMLKIKCSSTACFLDMWKEKVNQIYHFIKLLCLGSHNINIKRSLLLWAYSKFSKVINILIKVRTKTLLKNFLYMDMSNTCINKYILSICIIFIYIWVRWRESCSFSEWLRVYC